MDRARSIFLGDIIQVTESLGWSKSFIINRQGCWPQSRKKTKGIVIKSSHRSLQVMCHTVTSTLARPDTSQAISPLMPTGL